MNIWFAIHRVLDFLFCDRCIIQAPSGLPKFLELCCPLMKLGLYHLVDESTDPRGRLDKEPMLFPKNVFRKRYVRTHELRLRINGVECLTPLDRKRI